MVSALLIFVIGFASKKSMFKRKNIKIGGFNFSVKEIDGLADSGSTDLDNSIILIKKNQSEDRKKSALIHECIEVINELYDLNLAHQTIQTLEAGIFAFYKDNK